MGNLQNDFREKKLWEKRNQWGFLLCHFRLGEWGIVEDEEFRVWPFSYPTQAL